MSRRAPLLLLLAAPLSLWEPVREIAERRMLTHMVVVFPLLLFVGWVVAGAIGPRARRAVAAFDGLGLPSMLLVTGVLTVWMIPNAMDMARASVEVDAAKTLSLLAAGAALRLGSERASLIVQLFFVGNWVTMTVFVGVLFQSVPSRLCNAYLLGDQANAGVGLVALGAIAGASWAAYAYRRASGAESPRPRAPMTHSRAADPAARACP